MILAIIAQMIIATTIAIAIATIAITIVMVMVMVMVIVEISPPRRSSNLLF